MSALGLIMSRGIGLTIQRRVTTVDAVGSIVETPSVVGTTTGFVQPSSANRGDTYGAQRNSVGYTVYLPVDADVRMDDQLTFDSASSKRTLRITGIQRPGEFSGGPLCHLRADAYEELPRGNQ